MNRQAVEDVINRLEQLLMSDHSNEEEDEDTIDKAVYTIRELSNKMHDQQRCRCRKGKINVP